MKNVLLVTDGVFHPPLWGRLTLHRTLAQMEGFAFQHVRSLERLASLELEDTSALVIYIHHKLISAAALNQLELFVTQGGGLLAVHSATASFKQTLPYFKILGGRFIGHGKVEAFEVKPVPGHNDPFAGIGQFTLKDELYLHETQPGIQVHFTARQQREEIPVVWTYFYGKGRVCYVLPGHLSITMRNPTVQQVLKRGLEWVSQS